MKGESELLADMLRDVLPDLPASQQTALVPWIAKLQLRCDAEVRGSAPCKLWTCADSVVLRLSCLWKWDYGCPACSIADMVQFALLADSFASSGNAKEVVLQCMRAALPATTYAEIA
eukprot:12931875-Alexandrium_andersonii.AAC.1